MCRWDFCSFVFFFTKPLMVRCGAARISRPQAGGSGRKYTSGKLSHQTSPHLQSLLACAMRHYLLCCNSRHRDGDGDGWESAPTRGALGAGQAEAGSRWRGLAGGSAGSGCIWSDGAGTGTAFPPTCWPSAPSPLTLARPPLGPGVGGLDELRARGQTCFLLLPSTRSPRQQTPGVRPDGRQRRLQGTRGVVRGSGGGVSSRAATPHRGACGQDAAR